MLFWLLFIFSAISAACLIFARLIMIWQTNNQIIEKVGDAPQIPAAIVFGAGLWGDGSPTPVLKDRVATAAELFFEGKVEKLLMSGDNRVVNYNEPAAMRDYALELGVPNEAIVLDYAGRRTYDTCYRARDIFKVKKALLVTQKYHLFRALYICNNLGVQSMGVIADRRDYHQISLLHWKMRELPAAIVTIWEIHITKPIPVLGEPEPIFPSEEK